MALDTASYFILISSGVNLGFSAILVIFLIVNFIRKKTIGTAMLLTAYTFFSLTSAASIIYRILYIVQGGDSVVIEQFASLGPLLLLPAFAYLYVFACRHILKDSEIMRTYIFALIVAFFGIATAVVAYDNFNVPNHLNRVFTTKIFVTNSIYTISYINFILIFQIAVSIYVTGRIGWRALRLARKSDQPVRKRGLQTIGVGVLLYLLGGMLSAFDSSISGIPVLMIAVAVLRAFAFAAAYIGMYLGWVMPNWYRKMIRKRSWFEVQYKAMAKGAENV
jgi:hypothetical protein